MSHNTALTLYCYTAVTIVSHPYSSSVTPFIYHRNVEFSLKSGSAIGESKTVTLKDVRPSKFFASTARFTIFFTIS